MSDERADTIEKPLGLFTSTPLERHGDSGEGKLAAAKEADRLFDQFWAVMDDAELRLAPIREKAQRLVAAELAAKVAREDYEEVIRQATGEAWGRGDARLNQVKLYDSDYVRAGRKSPPARSSYASGDLVYKKNRSKTEWVSDAEILAALDEADPPMWVAEQAARLKREPAKKWIGEHLEDVDGVQYLVVIDEDTGDVWEGRMMVTVQEEGGLKRETKVCRTIEPETEYTVTPERRE